MTNSVLILGTGIGGLAAAASLDSSGSTEAAITLIDKARGVGGRMCTRRLDGFRFDHGAQFIKAVTPEFQELLTDAEAQGAVRTWWHTEEGVPVYFGVDGMSALPKYLAATLSDRCEIHLSHKAVAVACGKEGWLVTCEDGQELQAEQLLMTAPLPQVQALVADRELTEKLPTIEYHPCIAVMFTQPETLECVPARGVTFEPSEGISIVVDNRIKCQANRLPAYTAHLSYELSERLFEATDEEVWSVLQGLVGFNSIAESRAQIQRWRYAEPKSTYPEPYLKLAEGLWCAGEAFGGPRVEGAFSSGQAVAKAIAATMG